MTAELPLLLQSFKGGQAWEKPTGYSTHNEAPSLLEFLQRANPAAQIHFLNRLDRETSGIVIVADSAASVASLQNVWGLDSTLKIYVGIHRRPRDFAFKEQIWDLPLTDKAEGRKNPQGLAKDRLPCRTWMTPLAQTDHLVLSLLTLATGRQHQLRKHSSIYKMELIGDLRYGDPGYTANLARHVSLLRLGLHATFLQWCPEATVETVFSQLPDFFSTQFSDANQKVKQALQNGASGPLTVR